MRESQKRYLREFLPAMTLFGVTVFLSNKLLASASSAQLRACYALLPAIPAVFVILAMVRRIRTLDELQRRIELEAALIASLLVGMASFMAGFLVEAHVIQVSIIAVFPTMIAVYTLAQTWTAWRYR
jgi:hypothetical protein